MAIYGLVKPFALYWERSAIVVVNPMYKEYWGFNFMGVHKWRHLIVDMWCFPVGALLALKAEWR